MQQRSFLIEILCIERCENLETLEIVKDHAPLPKGDESVFAQLPKNTVHMHRAQTKRVGKVVLRQRTVKARPVAAAHEFQPRPEFKQEMRHALFGRATAKVDQVLHHHRLVPRRGPENCGGEPWGARKSLENIRRQNL